MQRRRVRGYLVNGNGVTPPGIYTMEQLVAVTEAIASGVTRVSYDGKSTEFRSLDDLLRLQEIMQNALGVQEPGRPSTTVLCAHDRGHFTSFGRTSE